VLCVLGSVARGQACQATPTSLTPSSWSTSPPPAALATAPSGPLRLLQEIPLPGPANRFDYQSLDPSNGHLYMSHMNAGTLLVFDVNAAKLLSEVPSLSRATGVWGVPSHHAIYVSAAGLHQSVVLDDRTFQVIAHIDDIRFPDGIAFAPREDKVFVSDESGAADVVIDAKTNTKRSTIALGGEAGNTHYDSVSHCMLVAVQTRNQIVAIDPATEQIVQRYDLPGSDEPHGFVLDEPGRLAFVSSQGNALLQVVDLRTMRVVGSAPVGKSPDVLAWDTAWRRLYVATEGGVLNSFTVDGATLHALPEYQAPHAHTVAIDPRTHRVYLPLEAIDGKPVLRILTP
jgi:DNA-binding beta-propeller fold protein YncE